MTPESKVRDPTVRWAKQHDIGHVRMAMRIGVAVGVPDDLFLLPNGWSIWIEFKAKGKKPSPKQYEKIAEALRRRHYAMWTDDKAEAIRALAEMLTWAPK